MSDVLGSRYYELQLAVGAYRVKQLRCSAEYKCVNTKPASVDDCTGWPSDLGVDALAFQVLIIITAEVGNTIVFHIKYTAGQ